VGKGPSNGWVTQTKPKHDIPYIIIYTRHHPLFSLADGNGETIGFAFALGSCWLRAYRTIGIHDLDLFVVSGVLD
jgi:hypothetical protein